jgi:hypothetical protein
VIAALVALLAVLAAVGCGTRVTSPHALQRRRLRPVVEHAQPLLPRTAPNPRICPGKVPGARTRLANIPAGVEITIKARTGHARDEIRRRAASIVADWFAPAGSPAARSCLLARHRGTAAEIAVVPGGVRVRVTAAKPEDGDALRRSTRERAEAMAASGVDTGAAPPSRGG